MTKQYYFDVDIATKYGILEAVILNNLAFWIDHNKANEKNLFKEHYWTYNTLDAWHILMPFASRSSIQRALTRLVEKGVLLKDAFNKHKYDKTAWYAFVDEDKWLFWYDKSKSHNETSLSHNETGLSHNETTIPDINTDNKTNINKDSCSDFESFWKIYPRKEGKGAARKSFEKIKPTKELLAKMLKAVECQAKSEQWQKDNGQFIPMPATWLNQERWSDELPVSVVDKEADEQAYRDNVNLHKYFQRTNRIPWEFDYEMWDKMTVEQRVEQVKLHGLVVPSGEDIAAWKKWESENEAWKFAPAGELSSNT